MNIFEDTDIVSSYTREQAIEDGVLAPNPRKDVFSECDMITTNLFYTCKRMTDENNRNLSIKTLEKIGGIMAYAKKIYDKKEFKGDDDENFFTIKEGLTIWFVRNEAEKLTAMLPEDY